LVRAPAKMPVSSATRLSGIFGFSWAVMQSSPERKKLGRRVGSQLTIPGTMRRLFGLLFLAPLSGCLQLGTPGDSGGGIAGASSAGSSSSDAGAPPASGTNCGVDPSSGIALCLGITSCPTVRVDPDLLPGCGYRIAGSLIDLECLCNDSLCPVGSAASCADAKALLADQSQQGVCTGIAEGRCTALSRSASDSNANTKPNCDKNCRAECGGDLGCITQCGC
jgi:hypothetical protein